MTINIAVRKILQYILQSVGHGFSVGWLAIESVSHREREGKRRRERERERGSRDKRDELDGYNEISYSRICAVRCVVDLEWVRRPFNKLRTSRSTKCQWDMFYERNFSKAKSFSH